MTDTVSNRTVSNSAISPASSGRRLEHSDEDHAGAGFVGERVMTTADAALCLQVSTRTIRSMIADGRLPARRDGQRWLVCAATVLAEAEVRNGSSRQSETNSSVIVGPASSVELDGSPGFAAPGPGRAQGGAATISASTLRMLLVVAALLLIACSALIARSQLASGEPSVSTGIAVVASPGLAADGGAGSVARSDVLVLLAGAGLTVGVQMIAFAPNWLRRTESAA